MTSTKHPGIPHLRKPLRLPGERTRLGALAACYGAANSSKPIAVSPMGGASEERCGTAYLTIPSTRRTASYTGCCLWLLRCRRRTYLPVTADHSCRALGASRIAASQVVLTSRQTCSTDAWLLDHPTRCPRGELAHWRVPAANETTLAPRGQAGRRISQACEFFSLQLQQPCQKCQQFPRRTRREVTSGGRLSAGPAPLAITGFRRMT